MREVRGVYATDLFICAKEDFAGGAGCSREIQLNQNNTLKVFGAMP